MCETAPRRRNNLVPRVFSLFKMAAARHTADHVTKSPTRWGCIQNGSYGEKGEKNWVRDVAKVKILDKMAEKAEVQFKKKNRKNRHVLHVRVLGIRQSVRGLVFAVHCNCFFLFF